jgi:predicted signal transduction protein with EAL and GGDEF domain
VGDRLLRAVADRVAACFRSDDHVARIGGDEMVVLGPGVGSAAGARDLAERILRAFDLPFELDEKRFDVNASLGISLYPADGGGLDTLLARADAALYAAKHGGGSRYAFYSPDLTASAADRVHIKTDLRQALDAGAIEVAFQEILTLDGRRLAGREALASWRTAEGETIPPDRFIPVAESTGMIGELGDQVLARACAQAARWDAAAADAWLAVNVAPVQLEQPDFDVRVRHAAARAGLDPARLVLEITEEAIAREDGEALAHLARLREAGVRIAVDDFGTGYASLKSLATLPVDHVKIDRHFVRDVDTDVTQDAIVRTVVRLTEALGLTMTAAGVETEGEAARVAELGCSRAQGFLFDEPRIPSA